MADVLHGRVVVQLNRRFGLQPSIFCWQFSKQASYSWNPSAFMQSLSHEENLLCLSITILLDSNRQQIAQIALVVGVFRLRFFSHTSLMSANVFSLLELYFSVHALLASIFSISYCLMRFHVWCILRSLGSIA